MNVNLDAGELGTNLPWVDIGPNVTSIVVEDEISPVNTDRMFFAFASASSTDVSKLDVSNVESMDYMFTFAGLMMQDFRMYGLDNWDTSNVQSMNNMFYQTGNETTTFDIDLSNWNVSNVTDMSRMSVDAGRQATTFDTGDLSLWDVSNVTIYNNFYRGVSNSIIPPSKFVTPG